MIFYTNHLVRPGFAGLALGPFIFIRPEYKDDHGLLAHEKCHVAQFWSNPLFHGLRYRLSKSYRLACEVEAYRVQLGFSPYSVLHFAERIANKYDLDITVADAAELLK